MENKLTDVEVEKVIIYYRETNWQSIVADTYMFASLIGAMFINHFYLGGSGFWGVVLFGLVMIAIFGRANSKKNRFGTKEELLEHIEKTL